MLIKYTFADDQPLGFKNADKVSPQKLGEELQALREQHDGELNTDPVIEFARKNKHAELHQCYNWNVHEAAMAHWRDQTRAIIRSIRRVPEEPGTDPVREYFSIRDRSGISYRNIDDVRTSTDLQMRILQQAERDLASWEARYSELFDLFPRIREIRKEIEDRINRRKQAGTGEGATTR